MCLSLAMLGSDIAAWRGYDTWTDVCVSVLGGRKSVRLATTRESVVMSCIEEVGERRVNMAHLSIVGCTAWVGHTDGCLCVLC